jgi:hypothetical protein
MAPSATATPATASSNKSGWGGAPLAAVLAAALCLTWPAVYNRFPLLYPDSMSYLESGHPIARIHL